MAPQRLPSGDFSSAERTRLLAENEMLRRSLLERHRVSDLAGDSRAIRRVRDQILQVAPSEACVLLRGEPGTGRARAARSIHAASARASGPFVTLYCAAMPDAEVETQLFGLRRADGGTLFLDEPGHLGRVGQAMVWAVARGGTRSEHAHGASNVRLLASTAAPLESAVSSGAFRQDLFEQLATVTLRMPPLRERKNDLPVLTALFVERCVREYVRRVDRVSDRAMDMLMHYEWPGNVGELRRAIEQAVVLTSGSVIHHHHLPAVVQDAGVAGTAGQVGLSEALDVYEKDLLMDALRRSRGVRSEAARRLLTSERVLGYRLRKHGIDPRQFRAAG
jgi:Nif-specific regulatory protein